MWKCTALMLGLVMVVQLCAAVIPPTIIRSSERLQYFVPGTSKTLVAEANGTTPLSFVWKLDGKNLQQSTSSLQLNNLSSADAGVYQCYVSNSAGTAVSDRYHLLEATLQSFPMPSNMNKDRCLGCAVHLECPEAVSVPKAEVKWKVKSNPSSSFQPVVYNRRISLGLNDDLYFANIEETDINDIYRCSAKNPISNETNIRQYTIQNGTMGSTVLAMAWSSPPTVLGLVGDEVKLKCIFSGNPTPQVTWRKQGSSSIIVNQELIFNPVAMTHAGVYECSGRLSPGGTPLQHSVTLTVNSRPEWQSRPFYRDIEVGETATFACTASSVPTSQIDFAINGADFNAGTYSYITRTTTGLTVTPTSTDDALTIQCNASNSFGYLWTNAALNVRPAS